MQARISELSSGNDEGSLEIENEEESIIDSIIEDGYYDAENKVTWHVEEDGSMCPVPDGYVGSEATGEDGISTGYVIYEGTDDVTDENVATAKTTRNQYVWIPVDNPSELYGTDSNGKKWGKLYSFSTSSGITALNWTESNGIMSITNKSSYREPDVLSSNADSDNLLKKYLLTLDISSKHEFLIELEKEFNVMIESVEKYGGFYIGRYETGNLSLDTAVVIQGNTDINYSTWYNSYNLCKTLSGNNENVVTGLIWGCQWDRALIWLIESGNKTVEQICDSTTFGNYRSITFQYINSDGGILTKNVNSSTKIPTGSTEYTNTNNVYDLAGNVYDLTMEAYSDRREARGSNYYEYSGSVSSRYNLYYATDGDVYSRL